MLLSDYFSMASLKNRLSIQSTQYELQDLTISEKYHALDSLLREVCLNRVDELATIFLMSAENKYRKFRNKEFDYSPESKKSGKTWHF